MNTIFYIVLIQISVFVGWRMGKSDCGGRHGEDAMNQPPSSSSSSSSTAIKISSSGTSTTRRTTTTNDGKVRRGIVLTSQCSGSEWVVSSLNAAPGVTWHLERMKRYSRTYMNEAQWQAVTWDIYHKELEEAFTTPATIDPEKDTEITPAKPTDDTPATMIGFKLMYDQIPQQLRLQFAEWLEEHNVHVVHLRRKCAALQWASQMDKYMRKYRQNVKKDHIYSKAEADALPDKDWEITVEDSAAALQNTKNRWLYNIQLLYDNQEDFARYLHVYAARAPVFEFSYESLDGPHQVNWFNALYAFLGLDFVYTPAASSKTVKTGKRTCEDRMVGLGGPALPLLTNVTASRVECLRMRALAGISSSSDAAAAADNKPSSVQILRESGLPQHVMMPPADGRCRLGPNCKQMEYGKYLTSNFS